MRLCIRPLLGVLSEVPVACERKRVLYGASKKKFRQASHISDITSPTQEMVVQQLLIVDSLAWGIVQQEKLNMASALARQ